MYLNVFGAPCQRMIITVRMMRMCECGYGRDVKMQDSEEAWN